MLIILKGIVLESFFLDPKEEYELLYNVYF